MSDYLIVWVGYAVDQYLTLDDIARAELDAHLTELARDPTTVASHDSATDHWSSDFGAGEGIVLSLVSTRHHRIVILRIIYLS